MSRFIQISSKYRTRQNDKSHDCLIELPQILRRGTYALRYALIPNSFYNVNEFNNVLVFEEGIIQHTIVIESGIYDEDSLKEKIAEEMNIQSGGYNTYVIEFNEISNKYTITANNSFSLLFSESTINELMGFSYEDTDSNVIHTSDNIVNLSPLHTINLNLDQISSVSQKLNHGTTFIIPIPNSALTYYNYEPSENFEQIMVLDNDKRVIHCTLRDERNNIVDLNGIDWMIIIEQLS